MDVGGSYDPRVRPWYIAGSRGPNNVIMILDVSGSVEGLRLEFMKAAAKRVVEALTVSNRVADVPFLTSASLIVESGGTL
jgi:Mg-chelatase subunit ChlD